jgi:hypothetical protein
MGLGRCRRCAVTLHFGNYYSIARPVFPVLPRVTASYRATLIVILMGYLFSDFKFFNPGWIKKAKDIAAERMPFLMLATAYRLVDLISLSVTD